MSSSHVVSDQSDVIAFLSDPASHGIESSVERIDTQSAVVFLAGDDVFKLKRAVRFPFMDLSTVEKRRRACEAEIDVNRANAPTLYLGALPISEESGGLRFGGEAERAIDWVVHMRRYPESRSLSAIASNDEALSDTLIRELAHALHGSHQRAATKDGETAYAVLGETIQQNAEAFPEWPDLFPAEHGVRLSEQSNDRLHGLQALLLKRGRDGFVRRCHGDLHLGNVVLLDDEATLVDAIEFDDRIATIDLLHDLAFPAMDLWHHRQPEAANRLLNRYLWLSAPANLEAMAAFPLFVSLRAALRAKVVAASLDYLDNSARTEAALRARAYFELAVAAVEDDRPSLVAIGGLSGTGKSTVATRLAPMLGRPPGALHLRSDIERKRLWHADEFDRLPAEAYSAEQSEAVYARLNELAATALSAGQSVIVDGVFARDAEREDIAEIARTLGVPFHGLWLEAPATVLADRVTERRSDASDATAEVVSQQSAYQVGSMDWQRIDAAGEVDATVDAARGAINFDASRSQAAPTGRHSR